MSDGRSVVAKVFDLESDNVEARVEHEFSLIQALDVEGVVKALARQRVGDQLVLLLERVPGVDLAEYAGGEPLDLDSFFAIAIQAAEVLGRVHERRVIHRDIKPTNVLIDPDSGRVYLADFGISVLLESERRYIYDPDVLAGTLPYISPEQTGRTGRKVDFRSDLYSLGITFYELLTGRRPFEFDAPLDLIHAHLARTPKPPRADRREVPEALSRIVMKLLEKAPEHRYQTATGLAADLRKLRAIIEVGADTSSMALGREDFPRTLELPHQLYGRLQERHELVDELERVMRCGGQQVMLLGGAAGIGKSSLLSDFEGPVAGFGGYLARGRFLSFSERPYSGFCEAFSGLIEQILTESEARLQQWRGELLEALGGVGKVVVDLVPQLELVIGEQPPVAELEPHETRNRMHLAVGRFLSAFSDDDRPLVVVLDDLHWADRSSLSLLRALTEGGRHGTMLFLGSFREDAIGPEHPLHELIEELGEGHRIRVIRLPPLSDDAVAAFLADTLARPVDRVRRLAKIVTRKTGNNPLFIRQFLTLLEEQGVLRAGEHGWTWELTEVEAAGIPDDVIEVMAAKIEGLAAPARELLAIAACIGARFDLQTLEVASGKPPAQLVVGLHPFVEDGLLVQLPREQYGFAHDRIQAAAHACSSPAKRRQLHWTIARHMLGEEGEGGGERLFEIVDQLDAALAGDPDDTKAADTDEIEGRPPLDEAGALEIARLNLEAGRRALTAAAYDPALRYLGWGIALTQPWRAAVARRGAEAEHYELVVELHFARAQCLALDNQRDEAEAAFDELFAWRLDHAHFGRVAARRVRLMTLEDQPVVAVEIGVNALERLGVSLPRRMVGLRAMSSLVGAWLAIRRTTTEELLALPECTDERISAIMEVVTATKNASYVVDDKLFATLIGLHVKLFLRFGFHPTSPLALGQLAMGVGPGLGRVEDAISLCEQGLALAERVPDTPARARVQSAAYLFVWHLGRPFAEPLAHMDEAYERALEAGDFEYAGYMGALALSMHFDVGTHLRVVERLSRRLEHDLGRWGSQEMVLVAWMIRQVAITLAGASSRTDEESPTGEDPLDILNAEAVEARGGSRVSVYGALANRAKVKLIMGEPERALALCNRMVDDVEQVMFGIWIVPRVALTGVAAAAMVLDLQGNLEPRAVRTVRKGLSILRRWAKNSRDNYGHYLDLAEGVRLWMRSRPHRAMERIERARVHAGEQGCRWVEGLAAELLATIAARQQLESFARGARAQAWEAYRAWGAGAKLDQLELAHPDQFGELSGGVVRDPASSSGAVQVRRREASSTHSRSLPRSSITNAEILDFECVLQSVRAMTAELRLDEVIAQVLDAAITNAGADRGVLVLERDDRLGVVAEASVGGEREVFSKPIPLAKADALLPTALLNFVLRTRTPLVLDDARTDPRFANDEYVMRNGVQSLLGMPILKGERKLGALVLENRLTAYCFTPERLEALDMIAGQAASALENARLFAALGRSEARWRSLVDGAPDVIALLNGEGEFEFVNREDLLGHGDPRTATEQLRDLLLSSSAAAQWREASEAVLRNGVLRELEVELPLGQSPRWFALRLAPIEAGSGGSRRAIVVATDITERKLAELKQQELEAQLRQQQRLESLGTLASGVAHEINNPVQGILNYAELIGDNLADQEIVEEFAREITNESNRVATIVRNLLAFSRQEREQQKEEVDMGELVRATLSLVRAVLRKDYIQISLEVADDLPRVHCRLQQIQQIVMNLVTNARDALNEEYQGFDERKRIALRVGLADDKEDDQTWVRLTVEDYGPGIPEDVLPRIFDPFFTTKGRDQGTGLGLAVSHGIVMDHGGDLTVRTKAGEWTRFRLDLPAIELGSSRE